MPDLERSNLSKLRISVAGLRNGTSFSVAHLLTTVNVLYNAELFTAIGFQLLSVKTDLFFSADRFNIQQNVLKAFIEQQSTLDLFSLRMLVRGNLDFFNVSNSAIRDFQSPFHVGSYLPSTDFCT